MGQSTDAIIAYGLDLGDEIEEFEYDEADGFESAAMKRLLAEIVGFTEQWTPNKEGYFDRKRAAEESLGIEIITHCSCDYPMHFLAARGSENRAYRGSPQPVGDLVVDPTWNGKIAKAMSVLGIKSEGEPAWTLFSNWC